MDCVIPLYGKARAKKLTLLDFIGQREAVRLLGLTSQAWGIKMPWQSWRRASMMHPSVWTGCCVLWTDFINDSYKDLKSSMIILCVVVKIHIFLTETRNIIHSFCNYFVSAFLILWASNCVPLRTHSRSKHNRCLMNPYIPNCLHAPYFLCFGKYIHFWSS